MRVQGTYPPISDYGLIGAMHSCALVSKAGSIDWCCLPDFDSPAVFGRLLDWQNGGFFQITPRKRRSVSRRYIPRTNVLETTFETEDGVARLTDFMPITPMAELDLRDRLELSGGVNMLLPDVGHHRAPLDEMLRPPEQRLQQKVTRILECVEGSVDFDFHCIPRFDYGTVVPHVALLSPKDGQGKHAFARGGGTAISVYCSVPMTIQDNGFVAEGTLNAGERLYSAVTHQPFFLPVAEAIDEQTVDKFLAETVTYWESWAAQCSFKGKYADDVLRSALTLKALTYEPTGAIVAAPTTSLPENPAGERNWDYRFTWIRDASFSLEALHRVGYTEEAKGFKRWIEWTAAQPEDLQIMYGIRGERWLTEVELPLEGYKWSTPVRIGNGAFDQFQLDIYGEILDSAHIYRKVILDGTDPDYWQFLAGVVDFVVANWRRTDAGIWETRGGYRHFVYSKVMCWVALDRGVKIAHELIAEPGGAERYHVTPAQIVHWEAIRDAIAEDVLMNGYDPNYRAGEGAFVQSYGSKTLDASVLMLPLVGFIPADDPRMRSTIDAVERDLTSSQGFVYRYKAFDDGLSGSEGTFTICTFWLIDNFIALGELDKAEALFETVKGYANDLGLLSEEIDPETGEMLGNFPQAFSHLAFIDNAVDLDAARRSASQEVHA